MQIFQQTLRHRACAADEGHVISTYLSPIVRGALGRFSLALSALFAISLFATTSFAGAVVTTVPSEGGSLTVGLQSPNMAFWADGDLPTANTFANPRGYPVLHSSDVYAIYWDPTDHYHGDWQRLTNTFFHNFGAASGSLDSVFAVDAQYSDLSNRPASYLSTFHGAYTDTDPYPTPGGCTDPHPLNVLDQIGPEVEEEVAGKKVKHHTPVCLTDKQIRVELETFVASHGLQKGMGSVFYLLTPPGVTVCLDGGGPAGHCSDFDGKISEIETFEDENNKYPKDLAKYENEREEGFPEYEEEKKLYEAEKKQKEEKHETPLPVEPEKPTAPTRPTAPASYSDYEKSFCSYHADISPTNQLIGDERTILYAVIPWTAGGLGDGHLVAEDQTPAYGCQDGGFDPASDPIEQKEHEPEKKAETKEEEEKKNPEEKLKQEEARKREGPHQEEPNQLTATGPDGSYDTGLADLIINQVAVEQQNIVTDPLLNAWRDEAGNEATDECRNFFASTDGGSAATNEKTLAGDLYNQSLSGGTYYLNDAFNAAALNLPYPGVPCVTGISLEPSFTAPNPVNSAELVDFDGMESNITLDTATNYAPTTYTPGPTYAIFTWNFGDGTPPISGYAPGATTLDSPNVSPCAAPWLTPCAASTFHSYQYGGIYEVTLTVTDVGGNTASVTKQVTVVGPPAPGTTSAPGTAPATAGAQGQAAGSGSNAASGAAIPSPVASERIASTSLQAVIKGGLLARYAVNEQVAGHFEVILSAALARKLGIHGKSAVGLAPGTPASVVIGEAILVTTQSARGTEKIKFGKHVLAGLRKASKVPLMLRLIVRNAAPHNPKTASVLTVGTLRR